MSLATAIEDVWRGGTPGRRIVGAALAPLGWGYGTAMAIRNALYDAGLLRARRVGAHVVSVGNLGVGGSGKTPTTLWLAAELGRRGRRVAIVGRGYGKRRPGVVVVGAGGAPLVDPVDGGDEAVLAAERTGLPVVTGEDRAAAAALAIDRFGVDTIVLDDGFQHRALARDADLVVVPNGMTAARLLPAGPLREPWTALGRARAVLALGDDLGPPPRVAAAAGVAVFLGRVLPTCGVVARDGRLEAVALDDLPHRGVVAVAGVSRPERFFALLERRGIEVAERLRFPDHHPYDTTTMATIAATSRGAVRPIVTTEKDLVKLIRMPEAATLRLHALRIEVVVEAADALLDCLLAGPQLAFGGD